jgi:circadian clock protein KaiB
MANLTRLCLRYLPGRHHIELVDVLRDPKRALEDHIYMTPTLVKLSPIPIGKIVGTLTEPKFVLQLLGVLVA